MYLRLYTAMVESLESSFRPVRCFNVSRLLTSWKLLVAYINEMVIETKNYDTMRYLEQTGRTFTMIAHLYPVT